MKKFLIIFVLLFSSLVFVVEGEIVINKKGESVLLKSDGTWEILSSEGEDGKVVFLIRKAVDEFRSVDRQDDMGEFSHYDNYAGCDYSIEVINKTDHKIKINMFKISSNNKKLLSDSIKRSRLIQFNQLIEPGDSYVGVGQYGVDGPYIRVGKTTELPSEDQIKQWISQYGCEAQKGSVFIKTADMGKPDISFSKDSGISDDAKSNFIIGSSNGMYPLIKEIILN